MDIKEPKLTNEEQEKLAFIVGAFAHSLTQEEQKALAASITKFALMVTNRFYTYAENEGVKKAYQSGESDTMDSH